MARAVVKCNLAPYPHGFRFWRASQGDRSIAICPESVAVNRVANPTSGRFAPAPRLTSFSNGSNRVILGHSLRKCAHFHDRETRSWESARNPAPHVQLSSMASRVKCKAPEGKCRDSTHGQRCLLHWLAGIVGWDPSHRHAAMKSMRPDVILAFLMNLYF